MTINIEKLAKENGFVTHTADDGECYADIETLKQFAEAYAAKVLEDKEREIEKLKEKFKSYKEESLNEIVSLNKACYEYKTNINVLREGFTQLTALKFSTASHIQKLDAVNKISELALAKTAPQSLQAFENEVIERCAKVLDERKLTGTAEAIRALKGKQDGT